jgi:hypothetical protein
VGFFELVLPPLRMGLASFCGAGNILYTFRQQKRARLSMGKRPGGRILSALEMALGAHPCVALSSIPTP